MKWPLLAAAFALVACSEPRTPQQRAVQWLAEQQDERGMFACSTYGVLARGESTTAAVALAIARLPDATRATCALTLQRAIAALLADNAPTPPLPPQPVDYPCYTAAHLLHTLALTGRQKYAAHCERLIAWLRTRQFSANTACPHSAPEFGGFGLGDVPRTFPDGTDLVGLSVTTAVLEALQAAGVPHDDAMVQDARTFVERCQWFDDEAAPTKKADGGFCFLPTADWRAGKAGLRDVVGERRRARSYGTATADGVRALLACGLPADAPRVQAGLRWLAERGRDEVPGVVEYGDAQLERSLRLYWLQSLAALADRLPDHASAARWRAGARAQVTALQRPDGSFVGLGNAMKEDDPLVATALALGCFAAAR